MTPTLISRAKTGAKTIPTAVIDVYKFGPRMPVITTASTSAGKARKVSASRIKTDPNHPGQ
jgi:hypothetical protein